MKTSKTKVIISGGPLEDCKATAKRDRNDWLIPVCDEVLGGN
ncbi:hypothetical protein [Aquimarina spongiae]|nr:hypothetical protein [Aquimarina spongiae]